MVSEINTSNFDSSVLQNSGVVLVDFWASWCGPCRMLSPILDTLSESESAKATFYKINVDENPLIATRYNITSLPTVVVFKNGEIKNTLVGVRPPQVYKEIVS